LRFSCLRCHAKSRAQKLYRLIEIALPKQSIAPHKLSVLSVWYVIIILVQINKYFLEIIAMNRLLYQLKIKEIIRKVINDSTGSR
jgi:hypothetical protein